MMDCEQLREYYEPFALGVLDADERTELEAHLGRNCPTCTEGVRQARWLVSQLAYLAPSAEPPAGIRAELLARVATPVVARERQRWLPTWAWAAAAAVMLIIAAFELQQARNLRVQVAALDSQLNQIRSENETYRKAFAIASASGTRAITLTSSQQTPLLRAYWNPDSGLLLTAQQMPQPPSDRTYQLWVVPKQGKPISAGLFRPDAAGGVLAISTPAGSIADASALAITNEPSGGSPQPTTTPIWVGSLSS